MSQAALSGKNYVVTGANSGIGLFAARRFAELGANVALVCRNEKRGCEAVAEIIATTGNENISLYLADFSSLSSVSEMADSLLRDIPKIDVLCNNAGGVNGSRTVSDEGFETTFVSNHLSSFLLTKKLLPAILHAADEDLARIVFTSSYGHFNSALDFEDLGLAEGYSTLKAYGRSKLMNLLTARELQHRLAGKNVVASSFHPGTVRTPIWNKGGALARLLGLVLYSFMKSVGQGSDTFIWLASSEDIASRGADGHYFYERKRAETAKFSTDADAKRLWQVSEELIAPYL
ncbi:MAG: short-chain dehydrogenase [SAR86 cluster bacterium]|uniref:Short-chain dehydrogenase n=1 Tax=SAR86 cluster bacterium TaxID=2030880 RepID=A0A2A4X5B1_9GAMM|nr:MAG: short-chain dehydrogenase [SAR86 cluster bacterium]